MMQIRLTHKTILLIVFLIGFLLCISNIWGYPIYILDEAKNAEAAREMWVSGDWFYPRFNDELRTDKPPLHYFFMALAYKIFGVSAFSARFFSSLSGGLLFALTFYFIDKFTNRKKALAAVIIMGSAVFFVQEFHLSVPDPYLIFFITSALLFFYDHYVYRKYLSLFLFYFFLGLGVLSKGPVAVILPGIAVALFLITQKKFKWMHLFRYKPVSGLLLILLITTPWFYFTHLATDGAFTDGFFFQHNLQRFGNKMEGHGGIFLITWLFILLGLMPFSFFIVQALVKSWTSRRSASFEWFSWLIAVVFIIFFSISSTKLPNYTMPCYPFVAFLIGNYLTEVDWTDVKEMKWFRISFWIIIALGFILPFAGFIALYFGEPQLRNVSSVAFVLLFTTIGSVFALRFFRFKLFQKSLLIIALTWAGTSLLLFFVVFPRLTSQAPGVLAKELIPANAPIILYKTYDPSLPINFERTFPKTESKDSVLQFMKENKKAYLITKEKNLREGWDDIIFDTVLDQKALFENFRLLVLRNPEIVE